MEGLFVVHELLALLLSIVTGDASCEVRGGRHLFELAVTCFVQFLLLFQHLLSLFESLVHLDSLLHQCFLLLHLLVTLVSFLHDSLLKAVELRLRHLLGMVGVVREEQKFLIVTLLGLQSALDGCQLVVKADALFFQAFHDGLVGLANTLGLVVLDHGLVQAVLQDPNLPHLGGGLGGVHGGPGVQLGLLDVQQVELRALLVVLRPQEVELPLQPLHLRHGLLQLLVHRLRLLVSERRDLIPQRLVLILHLADDFLVLLDVQLGSLIRRLSFALEELETPLEILQLLL
mmetsp:Transcript_22/g.27  ORF Transcript_22/g.27 Transcript_22/m.27 type:complete len:288 (+) Transcript_22:832-1695(+)